MPHSLLFLLLLGQVYSQGLIGSVQSGNGRQSGNANGFDGLYGAPNQGGGGALAPAVCNPQTSISILTSTQLVPTILYSTRTRALPTTIFREITQTSILPTTLFQTRTITISNQPIIQTRTDLVTETKFVTRAQLVTETSYLTETQFQQITQTSLSVQVQLSTTVSFQIVTRTIQNTQRTTLYLTETQTETSREVQISTIAQASIFTQTITSFFPVNNVETSTIIRTDFSTRYRTSTITTQGTCLATQGGYNYNNP
ncbi:unnamed protein product [Meganyctiphanes norvegica]|uniref:Uncharacterized protein n=1 Tax=Meganyctiphanes norvegica TaxID=48144 RepID=A0AAV2RQY4_MEGNR